jgi:WhiB family redox-sensing transcriptional regulator
MSAACEANGLQQPLVETTGRTAEEFAMSVQTKRFLELRVDPTDTQDDILPYASDPIDWQERAKCKGEDTDLFYAPRWRDSIRRQGRIEAAKAICAACPVRALCQEWGLGKGDNDWWILGGLTPEERARFKAGRFNRFA